MRREAAQLDAVVAEVAELVHEGVEVVGRLLLVEEEGPAADREFLHGSISRLRLKHRWRRFAMQASFRGSTKRRHSLHPCASRTAIIAARMSFHVCGFIITSLGNMQPSQQMCWNFFVRLP